MFMWAPCRPTVQYAPWFNVVLKCARLATQILGVLTDEVDAILSNIPSSTCLAAYLNLACRSFAPFSVTGWLATGLQPIRHVPGVTSSMCCCPPHGCTAAQIMNWPTHSESCDCRLEHHVCPLLTLSSAALPPMPAARSSLPAGCAHAVYRLLAGPGSRNIAQHAVSRTL